MEVKFKKECTFHGKKYKVDEPLRKISIEILDEIWSLNERGFIYPISVKDFVEYRESLLKQEKKNKENEETNV